MGPKHFRIPSRFKNPPESVVFPSIFGATAPPISGAKAMRHHIFHGLAVFCDYPLVN